MKKNIVFPYLLVAPAVLLFALFTVYPIIASLILSFQKQVNGEFVFAGVSNYIRLIGDEIFRKAITNTFVIFIIQVPIMIFLALILANALNSRLLKFKGFFRTSFFMPAVTSLVAYSVLFSIMLQDRGLINNVLSFFGIGPIPWLSHPVWAKISIIIAMTWRWTGYNMVIFLAALQNLSDDIYEAASLDGAGKWQQFFYITIPQLKPVILFSTVLSTIGTLQLFDEPYNLTKGGPADSTMTLGLYIYQTAFNYFDFGYACAIAYVVVILVAILSFIQFKVTGEK
jgi:lactose/L-arabinose transport system permease protein